MATDLVPERLGVLQDKFAQLIEAQARRDRSVCATPDGQAPGDVQRRRWWPMTGGDGFDDIVVLAPSPA